jgi:agmatine/peptidylarginine deiminase
MLNAGWETFPIPHSPFPICHFENSDMTTTAAPTPRSLGYRMPAEWEPHAATWLSWPRNRNSWPGHFEPVPGIWAELAAVLAASEPRAPIR